jgi:hypothetical protein
MWNQLKVSAVCLVKEFLCELSLLEVKNGVVVLGCYGCAGESISLYHTAWPLAAACNILSPLMARWCFLSMLMCACNQRQSCFPALTQQAAPNVMKVTP